MVYAALSAARSICVFEVKDAIADGKDNTALQLLYWRADQARPSVAEKSDENRAVRSTTAPRLPVDKQA